MFTHCSLFTGSNHKTSEREGSLHVDGCEITGRSLPDTKTPWNFDRVERQCDGVDQEAAHQREDDRHSECTIQMDYANSLAGV